MITIKFSSTFRASLLKRVERHQELIATTLEEGVGHIYDSIMESVRYYHENHKTWKFWFIRALDSLQPPVLRNKNDLKYWYEGEVFTKEDIQSWLRGDKVDFRYFNYESLWSLVKKWQAEYRYVKTQKQYKYALMLLKYSSSFETITVPLDFLLWFEK